MKVWLVEICIFNRDDEYGNISNLYTDNKVFKSKDEADKYLQKLYTNIEASKRSRDAFWNFYYKYNNVYPGGSGTICYNTSKITEIEI